MDRLTKYRQVIQTLLSEYAEGSPLGGEIWIQRNQTDRSLTEDLLARDVVKEDIVLGFSLQR